jgi:single-strand DNA-binding protein
MSTDIKGTIHRIFEAKQISEKFRKREFVLHVPDGKYEQTLAIELTGDRCSLVDGFNEGDELQVSVNIKGREWKSPSGAVKYFVSLEAWKVQRTSEATSKPALTGAGPDDSLPF